MVINNEFLVQHSILSIDKSIFLEKYRMPLKDSIKNNKDFVKLVSQVSEKLKPA